MKSLSYDFSFDEKKRTQIIGMLFGAYGQANDAQRQAIYASLLKDLPNEILSKAVKKLLVESKFLPAIAEIVEAAKSLMGSVDDSQRVREWDEAWAEIEQAMFATPWGKTPTFSRPEITAAVNNYGWDSLQKSLAADMPTVRAQVRGMYETACKRAKERAHNEYVLGRSTDGLLQASVDKAPGLISIQATLAQIGARP